MMCVSFVYVVFVYGRVGQHEVAECALKRCDE
jgi:hypothetical protein